MSDRLCEWCGLALGLQRKDARFCGVACRQAMHREKRRRARATESRGTPDSAAALVIIAEEIGSIRSSLLALLSSAPKKVAFNYQMKRLSDLEDDIIHDLRFGRKPSRETGDASGGGRSRWRHEVARPLFAGLPIEVDGVPIADAEVSA